MKKTISIITVTSNLMLRYSLSYSSYVASADVPEVSEFYLTEAETYAYCIRALYAFDIAPKCDPSYFDDVYGVLLPYLDTLQCDIPHDYDVLAKELYSAVSRVYNRHFKGVK